MASAGDITVKVKPDLSAFRQADPESVTDVLMAHLEQRLDRPFTRADMRVVTAALQSQFTILPL